MKPATSNNVCPLAKATTMRIPDPAGREITCTRGHVWITLDSILQDFILTAGTPDDTVVTKSDRNALLYALDDLQIVVTTGGVTVTHARSKKPLGHGDSYAPMLPEARASGCAISNRDVSTVRRGLRASRIKMRTNVGKYET